MRRMTAWTAVLAGLWLLSPLYAQSDTTGKASPRSYRFGLSVEAVHLAATVVDKKGRLVTNLEQEDFLVYEDGVPQDIQYFSRGTDSPVDIMLLVDASGSMDMASKVANAKNAAIQVIHVLGAGDRVAAYAFAREVIQLSPFTGDKAEAIRAVERLEPFGSTAIYDAVADASDLIRGQGFGRRAIILITDGIDTSSQRSVEEAVEIAKGVDLPVYALRVLSPLDDPDNEAFVGIHGRGATPSRALERFTRETGGNLYEASQIGALRLASLRVKEELKTQYRLGYFPRNHRRDGRFRRIDIFVRQEGVEVRTRKGYYARANQRGASFNNTHAVTAPNTH